MTSSSRTSSDGLMPIALVKLFRSLARLWRGFRRRLLAISAVRDISDEAFHSDLTAEEQYGHEMLVADPIRMNAYRAGIRRNIKPGDVVVDLGTGTGILAMLAAQQRAKVVHALELSDMITLAERLAVANQFTNIVFHNVSSRRFALAEPVDVIVHEQIGQALFDEGVIEKTLDLKKRLLKKSGQIVPGRFELFLEPACVKDDYRVPYLWQTKFPGIDFSTVRDLPGNDTDRHGYDWQGGDSARSSIDYFLGDASPILAVDLNKLDEATDVPTTASASRVVRRSGRMDGFCLYFRVVFDNEG